MATTANSGAPIGSPKERLDQVQRDLETLRHKTNRATGATAVVGILALVAIAIYFYIGYTQFSQYTEPDKLVSVAQDILERNIPAAQESLKEQIIRSAPTWAEGLSQHALESLPTARTKLQEYILDQYDNTAQETIKVTDQQFRDFLRKNRPMLEKKFKELETNPKLADNSLAELEERMEVELQADMRAQAGELLDTLQSLNAKIKKLSSGQDLGPDELIERRLLMLARRMQLEQADPDLVGKHLAATPKDDIKPVALNRKIAAGKRPALPARPGLAPKPTTKDAKAGAKPASTGAKPDKKAPEKNGKPSSDKKPPAANDKEKPTNAKQ